MAGLIPRSFIDDVVARTDIVELIDSRVPLKKSGSHHTARCPFHQEKTPSFSVSASRQFYHCFGCGASGNALSFIMAIDHMGFVEAVEFLAHRVGLSLPSNTQAADDALTFPREKLYAIQQRAATYYASQLGSPASQPARTYLQQRQVSQHIQERYQLGYAPAGWRNLPQQWPENDLIEAGLCIRRDDGRCYDRFRDRIMFPIRDPRGRVTGFGGRILLEGQPKYLNSPETPVFLKHREVYGLHELLQTTSRPERIVVTEGYMDVIMLAEHGFQNAVATLGTAISTDQVNLLMRHTHEVVFCFDGDQAGQKAAWKALEASMPLLRDGKQVKFLTLPTEHDPDSLLRSHGAQHFMQLLEQAQPASRFLFDTLRSECGHHTLEQRSALASRAAPLVARLPEGHFQDLMRRELEQITGEPAQGTVAHTPAKPRQNHRNRQPPSIWRELGAMIAHQPSLLEHAGSADIQRLARHPQLGPLAMRLKDECRLHDQPLSTGQLLEIVRGETLETTVKALLSQSTLLAEEDHLPRFTDALKRLEEREKQHRLNLLIEKSSRERLNDEERSELRQLTSPPASS